MSSKLKKKLIKQARKGNTQPKNVAQQLQEAIRLHQAGKLTEADACYQNIVKYQPDHPDTLSCYGVLAGQTGRPELGIKLLRRAIQLSPKIAHFHFNLANIFANTGQFREAVAAYRQAIRLAPHNADAYNNLGIAHKALAEPDQAKEAFQAAIKLKPEWPEPYVNIGTICRDQGDDQTALKHHQKALSLGANLPEVHMNIGNTLQNLGNHDEAIASYKRAVALVPDFIPAIAGIAEVLEKQGESEKAYELLKPLIQQGQLDPNIIASFALVSKRFGRVQEALTILQNGLQQQGIHTGTRSSLHFQLAKLLDSEKRYDEAFAHLQEANRLKNAVYNRESHSRLVEQIMASFSSGKPLPHSTNQSELPVFIVGMPRSGTSLVEQVLAAHSKVFGAGELQDISRISAKLKGTEQDGGAAQPVTQNLIDQCAAEYLAALGRKCPEEDVLRVTDKMPYNYQNIGLISLMFPKARIIHCLRDPVDTCLSCFFQDFIGVHGYLYDQSNLVHYYGEYLRLMEFWKQHLNVPILEVCYDNMVMHQEQMSKALVAFCGLEWEDQCLHFHTSSRAVKTASFQQVREPVYTKSLQRWKNYQNHIGMLIDGLQEAQNDYQKKVQQQSEGLCLTCR